MAFSQNRSGVEAAFGRVRDISVRTLALGVRRAALALVLLAAMGLGCGEAQRGTAATRVRKAAATPGGRSRPGPTSAAW